MAVSPAPAADELGPNPRLDDRVMELLAEHPGRLAFNGLRRTLGAHPESLTRALRRLERDGRISHDAEGYTLRLDGDVPLIPHGAARQAAPRTVAAVSIPLGVDSESVLGSLAGRWFGDLRWVGVYEHPGEPTLVWTVSGADGHVMLSVRRGQLRVQVDVPIGSETGTRVEAAAQSLLAHALPRMRPSGGEGFAAIRGFAAASRPGVGRDN